MAVKLIYSDVPLGATEDAEISVSDASTFSEPELLPFGVSTGAVATLEHNGWGLSSTYKTKDKQTFALWSNSISNSEGVFDTPLIITADFTEQYTATGLTIRFSPDANEYCTKIFVEWWQGETIKESGYYYPTTANYVLENAVEAFDKITLTFYETNLPGRRLKIEQVLFGVQRILDGRELTDTSFVHEIDLISEVVPINVLDANFHSLTDTEFIFQKKQPVEAFNDNTLIGVYFIEKGEQTGTSTYKISCQDAIGTLDLDTYSGGIWFEDTPIIDIANEIVNGAFGIELDEALKNATVRGHIPECKKREALQHLAFAVGACVDTSGTSKIRLFLPPTNEGVEIPATETYTGGKLSTNDTVTEVSITAFDITNETPGERDEKIEFNGSEYKCVSTVFSARNPNITAGALENKKEFNSCYLINTNNAQTRADAILAYYMRRKKASFTHILKGQNLGDRATVHLPWGDMVSGNVVKMTIKVSGLTVSDTEFLTD
jgi:hypothetical protein